MELFPVNHDGLHGAVEARLDQPMDLVGNPLPGGGDAVDVLLAAVVTGSVLPA